MSKFKVFIICGGILLGSIVIILFLKWQKPEAKKKESITEKIAIEVITLKKENVKSKLISHGFLKAYRNTNAVSEVAGKIIFVSPKFKIGSWVKSGEILLKIDDSDYQAKYSQAKSNLSQAKLLLEQERVRSEKAKRDWKIINKGKKANKMVLRLPHLEAAKNGVESAKSTLEKAKRDIERCILKAPYNARIRQTYTDFANIVSPGTRLADLYELGNLELQVPIVYDKLKFLHTKDLTKNKVSISSPSLKGKNNLWEGKISQISSDINSKTRSIGLIINIKTSLNDSIDNSNSLLPGLFVNVEIIGKEIKNVFKIPRQSISDDNHVLRVDQNNKIYYENVKIKYQEKNHLYVTSKKLKSGDIISKSLKSNFIQGMEVKVLE